MTSNEIFFVCVMNMIGGIGVGAGIAHIIYMIAYLKKTKTGDRREL